MKYFNRFILILVPFLLLTACTGSKNATKSGSSSLSDDEFIYDAYFLEGLRLKTIGRFDEALANLEKAREVNPEEAVLHYQLAEVNTQLGDYAAAVHYAENAVALDADNVWYHVLLVQLYQNSGLFAKASVEMEEIIRLEPQRLEFYFMLSGLYQSIGDAKSAIGTMEKAEKKFGVLDLISIEKETIYLSEGKSDKAVKEVETLIAEFPEELRYRALLAELYISLNRIDDARQIYDELLEKEVTEGRVLLAMSEFYRGIRQYEMSFSLLKKAFADETLDLDMKIEMLMTILTTSGTTQMELETQKEIFDVLLDTHPKEPKALTIYSDYLVKAGDFKKAQKMIREVLETERDKYIIWEQLLYINNHLEDYESLLSDSDTIIELFPVQPIPYLFNSMAAYMLNQDEKSVKSAETGLRYALDDVAIRLELLTFFAESHHRMENYHQADSAFDLILELDPDNLYILNNYAYYLSQRGDQMEKARTMGKKLVALRPDNANYLDTYGWVLFVMKDYEGAQTYIKRAIDNGGIDRPAILEHYGDVLFMIGEKQEALKYWQKAADISAPDDELKRKIETEEL